MRQFVTWRAKGPEGDKLMHVPEGDKLYIPEQNSWYKFYYVYIFLKL